MDADKHALRQHYRALRDAVPIDLRDQRSAVITELLLSVERLQRAGSVFLYVSTASEVGTHGLIAELLGRGAAVAVPRIANERRVMYPMRIRSPGDLAPGRFGIPEPTTNDRFDATPDVTLVPGLAFTRTGDRLGMGGGFYDHYLAQHPATYKIGLCFNEQLADDLPGDAHDVAMDEVITG